MQRLKVGDIVETISGNHKGKQGKVLRFNKNKTRAFVEKTAMVKKHSKPTQASPGGGIIEKESSIHISNLMLVDPSNKKRGRIGVKTLKDGTHVRFFKKTGTELKAKSK